MTDEYMASPFKDPERRREYQQKYHKETWYPEHRQDRLDRSRKKRQEVRKWYREYKNTLHCMDCGQSHPATLDFHHIDPAEKDFVVSQILHETTSLRRLQEEIAKCVVLCANCHRIRHWNEKHSSDELLDDDL